MYDIETFVLKNVAVFVIIKSLGKGVAIMNKQLNAFLKNKSNENFIAVALDCEKKDLFCLSDFERFSLVCEHTDFFLKSHFLDEFLRILSDELSVKVDAEKLLDREIQKQIWRDIHLPKMAEISAVYSCREKNDTSEDTLLKNEAACFDITDFFWNYLLKFPRPLLNVEEEIRKIAKSKRIAIDMNNFEFSRPDDYHTRLIYEKIMSLAACQKAEVSCIILHLLCEIASDSDIDLCLDISDNLEDADRIIDFFDKRKKRVKISIRTNISDEKIFLQIFDILLKYPKKNISSEIIISEEISADHIEFLFCHNIPKQVQLSPHIFSLGF